MAKTEENGEHKDANARINGWMERIVLFIVTASVCATTGFLYQQQDTNQKFAKMLESHNARLDTHERRLADLQGQIIEAKSNMVTLEMLKRIELFMQSMPKDKAMDAMVMGMRSELMSHKKD